MNKDKTNITPRIQIYNIKKTYNNEVALDVPYLEIELGGVVAIMGYSGSGKSTFVNILGLIDVPDMQYDKDNKPKIVFILNDKIKYTTTYKDNKIIIKDIDNNNVDEIGIRAKIFGYIFQKHYLHGNFTIEQNIQIPLIIENKYTNTKSIENTLKQINLHKNSISKYPDNLSGGQAQRVSILRGIVKESSILVADEPTSSLDIVNAEKILSNLKNQTQSTKDKKIFIWVTHDIHLIARYSDDIVVLSGGKVLNNKVIKNPGIGKENEISSFLGSKIHNKDKKENFYFEKETLTLFKKIKYIYSYAYKELFKSPLSPTFDFKIGASSIIVTLFFLLFITKVNHSMNALLTFKLNNPSINNFSVTTKGGGKELDKEDVIYIQEKYKKDIKSASPVYLAPIDIKDNKSQDDLEDITDSDYVAGFRFVTFEKNDPVLISIINKDTFLTDKENAFSILTKDNIEAIILQKHVLQELGYKDTQKSLPIRLDSLTKDVQISVIDSTLPNNVDGILRSELYLQAYFGENITQKPSMSHIVVYPKDIKNSIRLSKEITKSGKYSISNFYELKTKIETILDISRAISLFSQTLSIALILLSISFVYLSLYRGIEKKRKEIGVFLANGISKGYFYLFYFTQAFIYFIVTAVISLGIYYSLIEAGINNFLFKSSYLKLNYGDLSSISEHLFLPVNVVFLIYIVYFVFIQLLFLFMINKFVSKKPVELMRE